MTHGRAYPSHGFRRGERPAGRRRLHLDHQIRSRTARPLPARLPRSSRCRSPAVIATARDRRFDASLRGEFLHAARGEGWARNSTASACAFQRPGLDGALIGNRISVPREPALAQPYLAMLERVMDTTAGVRRPVPLRLICVSPPSASTVFWEGGPCALGHGRRHLLISEAGGRISLRSRAVNTGSAAI